MSIDTGATTTRATGIGTIDDLPAVRAGDVRSTELPGAIDDLPKIAQKPYPLPFVRWRLAQVLLIAICVEQATVAGLLAIDAVEPADAKELLTVVVVPLYPLLGTVVAFYFTLRQLGAPGDAADRTSRPAVEMAEATEVIDLSLGDGREVATTRAEIDRLHDIAKLSLGAAMTGLVAVSIWSLRRRPEAVR